MARGKPLMQVLNKQKGTTQTRNTQQRGATERTQSAMNFTLTAIGLPQ